MRALNWLELHASLMLAWRRCTIGSEEWLISHSIEEQNLQTQRAWRDIRRENVFQQVKIGGNWKPTDESFSRFEVFLINGVSIHFWADSNACAPLHWIFLLRVTIWIHLHYQNCMCTIQIYYAAILDSCNNVSQWGYWSKSLMQNGTLAWKFSQLTWPWVKLTCRFYVRRKGGHRRTRWHEMTS